MLFRSVAAALSGTFSIAGASGQFVLVAVGGVLVGMMIGYAYVLLQR